MKIKFQILTIISFLIFLNSVKSQSGLLHTNKIFSEESKTEISPLLGLGNFPKGNFTFIRYGVAINNVLASNSNEFLKKLGFYYIIEHANNSNYIENNSSDYTRDVLGLRFKLDNHFTVFAGAGMFKNGIFSGSNTKRKEIGLAYELNHFLFEVAISGGIKSANIGYVIPFKF